MHCIHIEIIFIMVGLLICMANSYKRILLPKCSAKSFSQIMCNAKLVDYNDDSINICSSLLQQGKLVAFPTETVYGLGANAYNETAVRSIFHAKKRPLTDPLIVHICNNDDIHSIFDFSSTDTVDHISSINKAKKVCETLANVFWPGPLTIIYKASSTIPSCVTAETGYVGVRNPSHLIARALLQQCKLPIAAPSANRFGHVSPTTSAHVYYDLGTEDITIINDDVELTGGCTIGIESTVCRVSDTGDEVIVLRCGAITLIDIRNALASNNLHDCKLIIDNNRNINSHNDDVAATSTTNAVAPGQMIKHYAPDIPTYIIADHNSGRENMSVSSNCILLEDALVIDFGNKLDGLRGRCRRYINLSKSGNGSEACTNVFSVLRQSESSEVLTSGVKHVFLPDLDKEAEKDEIVAALWERLRRAASGVFLRI